MLDRKSFPDSSTLARALSDAVAADLIAAIEARGSASLAVSGGSTPARFFAQLGKRRDVEWEKVVVTLVDERWVDELDKRSNAGLVNEKLLQGPAASARFVPLYSGGPSPDDAAVARSNEMFKAVPRPFAAVVLGMGTDGHTASFFPGGDRLAEVLAGEGPAGAIEAPGAGEPRITLTLPTLLGTDALYLHIEGEPKAGVLDAALSDGPLEEMPVRAVLRSGTPLSVYWCP